MSKTHRIAFALAALGSLSLAGCHAPGKPEPEVARPEQLQDFAPLYKQNCAACHGEEGRSGLAVSLANPVYIAIAGKQAILNATAKGGPGALMPAFARKHGGTLTDQQVEILAEGIIHHWGRSGVLGGETPPSYAATLTGDTSAGETAFHAYCARCHSASNESQPASVKKIDAGSLTDPSYLALISDQSLRSTILSGRPDEGMPDWRGFTSHPLTDQQITDIVAWLASQRKTEKISRPGASQGAQQ
jgi:cytochrome c oxidase cbb3-type subunit 3/ubiquinol-cytochrome c reductase cytochrome c subunit